MPQLRVSGGSTELSGQEGGFPLPPEAGLTPSPPTSISDRQVPTPSLSYIQDQGRVSVKALGNGPRSSCGPPSDRPRQGSAWKQGYRGATVLCTQPGAGLCVLSKGNGRRRGREPSRSQREGRLIGRRPPQAQLGPRSDVRPTAGGEALGPGTGERPCC